MKVTIFTSNQPKHIALIDRLSRIAEKLFVIQECGSVFPMDEIESYHRSQTMKNYWQYVIGAERQVFGKPCFSPSAISCFPIARGDLNRIDLDMIQPALCSDVYIVFGTGFIKGELCRFLVEHGTVNVHMGILPFYKGSSCNFWALNDKRPELVGGTVHLLTAELDSGPILFHAFPKVERIGPFLLGMKAVDAVQQALVKHLSSGEFSRMIPISQDDSMIIRDTKSREFTDEISMQYLENMLTGKDVEKILGKRDLTDFISPFIVE